MTWGNVAVGTGMLVGDRYFLAENIPIIGVFNLTFGIINKLADKGRVSVQRDGRYRRLTQSHQNRIYNFKIGHCFPAKLTEPAFAYPYGKKPLCPHYRELTLFFVTI